MGIVHEYQLYRIKFFFDEEKAINNENLHIDSLHLPINIHLSLKCTFLKIYNNCSREENEKEKKERVQQNNSISKFMKHFAIFICSFLSIRVHIDIKKYQRYKNL
jgi:hypothetical protein